MPSKHLLIHFSPMLKTFGFLTFSVGINRTIGLKWVNPLQSGYIKFESFFSSFLLEVEAGTKWFMFP